MLKSSMFVCPLFCEQNKTAKLKGANSATLIGIVGCVEIVWPK